MCGIAVVLNRNHSGLSRNLKDLTDAIQHRGPDDQGSSFFPESGETVLSLGHRRLSILDLSAAGHQPLASDDHRHWISYNGEIYNYIELRQELERDGFKFSTATDTEVVLAAYRKWGTDCLARFVGMFSFAIFDATKNCLFIARDFFGIKPLYYWSGNEGIAFASEIKALLKLPHIQRVVNPARVHSYLTTGLTDWGTDTFYKDIHQMPAAHCALIDLKNSQFLIEPKRYWSPDQKSGSSPENLSFEQAAEKLRHLFLKSVGLHLRSDVPVGSCLSGGIDSSAIVMAMRKLEGNNLDLHTFSFVPNETSLSEEKWIDLVNQRSGAISHKVTPESSELLRDIDRLVATQDEPFGSTSIYAQYRVFQLAQESGIKVMLDGQGADELLAGYLPYHVRMISMFRDHEYGDLFQFWNQVRRNPGRQGTKSLFHFGASFLPRSMKNLVLAAAGRPPTPGWLAQQWFTNQGVEKSSRDFPSGKNPLKKILTEALTETSLPALLRYEDRNSMAFSIESRVPFLTPELTQFVQSLPESHLINPEGWTKAVFRKAMREIVPDEILDRRDKVGFTPPEKKWLTEFRPWVEKTLSSDTARSLPFFEHSVLMKEWTGIMDGTRPFDYRAWRWVNLIRWMEMNEVSST